jgi:hypothetical protein
MGHPAMLREMKQIISTSNIYGYSLGVLMEDYRQVLSEPDGAIVLYPDPYIGSYHQLIGIVLDELSEWPHFEVIAFLYDEHSKAHLLQASWPSFKEKNPRWGKHAGTLAPLDDKVHIPIQVADVLAYTTTQVYKQGFNDRDAGKKLLKNWLGRHMIRAVYMDARYLRTLVRANLEMMKAHRARYDKKAR